MSEIPHLLVHDHDDSVGVVVIEGLEAGTDMLVCVTHDDPEQTAKGNNIFRLTAGEAAPIGHKIALKNLTKGDTVFKYGEDIGIMTADVKKGEHVHTQNCKTKRW
jgi:(2R)-sulfolactate sulfo-lyase subunit alpha